MTDTPLLTETPAAAPATPPVGNNLVVLTGRIIARWVFEGDTYLRLVALRPRGFPPSPDGRRGDVVVARVNYFLAQTAPLPERGQLCRVRGFLQQQDGEETLEMALERLVQPEQAPTVKLVLGALLDLTLKRPMTEVVALSWELVAETPRTDRPRRERRDRRRETASAVPEGAADGQAPA